jgi:tetratricopeptide (TPR) repeat protein
MISPMKENLQYIENYFDGLLNATEREAFDLRIRTDNDFAQEVSFYLNAKQLGNKQKKEDFLQLHQQIAGQQNKQIFKWVAGSTAIAASILLVVWFSFFKNDFSPEQYANHYLNNNLQTLSVEMAVQLSDYQKGIESYNAKDYTKALGYFERDSLNWLSVEYAGLCLLQTKNYDKAIVKFEKIASQHELLQNKGLFLKALTQMKAGKTTEAKQTLESIITSSDDVFGRKEAQEILKQW